jgi:hypothetical protein
MHLFDRPRAFHAQITYIEYRAVSDVFRTIDPSPPLHPASMSSPFTKGGGGLHIRRAVRGWGGGVSIILKTPDIGLASYSIIPLRFHALCVHGENLCLKNTVTRYLSSGFLS